MRVGAICIVGESGVRELSFEEILLDETLVAGDIRVTKEALQKAGGINDRLGAKRYYELILRVAKEFRVLQVGVDAQREDLSTEEDVGQEDWLCLNSDKDVDETGEIPEEGLKTDCYLIARYKTELLSMGCFDDAVMGVVAAGGATIAQYLEEMLTGTEKYQNLYDCTQPILIYMGDEICYHVLDTFARSLGMALEEQGQHVIYFDMSKRQISEIAVYTGQRLKAVIGMQTYMFSVKEKDGNFVHDKIAAPKYHFVFDHPIWLENHLRQVPKRLTVLTPDGNYARFVEQYFCHPARFFPPAGQEREMECGARIYDISFLGTYGDGLLKDMITLRGQDRKKAHMLNRYVIYLRKYIDEPPERVFDRMLQYYGIHYGRDEWIEQFHSVRWVVLKLASYYRKKVVETLLLAGISLHVFGDSWKNCPLRKYSELICHEEAIGEQALEVYRKSKMSLNVMTWHKDGFTERIANAMLQKSVVVTDRTDYLEKNFVNGKELLTFDLRELKALPGRIKALLSDEPRQEQIAKAGYRKAIERHTWHQRAKELLELIGQDRNDM